MLQVTIRNFRNLKNVSFSDDNLVSLILGYNESGKSSFCGAISFAITGQAFSARGADVAELVTHGEERMSVRVAVGTQTFTRFRTGGDSIKACAERIGVTTDILPLLFNAKLVGDGGNRHMKAFLCALSSSRFDPKAHFASDPDMLAKIRQAELAGQYTVKQMIDFFERMRAAQKAPPAPVMPDVPEPTHDAVQAAKKALDAAILEYQDARTVIDRARDLLSKIHRYKAYVSALDTWEAQRAVVEQGDPLGALRPALEKVASIRIQGLNAARQALHNAGYLAASEQLYAAEQVVVDAVQDASRRLHAHPAPPTLPPRPTVPDDVIQAATEAGVIDNPACIDHVSASLVADIREADTVLAELESAKTKASAHYEQLVQAIGAWEMYRRALPNYEEQRILVEDAWNSWDRAVRALRDAEEAFRKSAGKTFSDLVVDYSDTLLQGRRITISDDSVIMVGNDPIDKLSESTRWRAEIAILAAVASYVKSPLLIIDGADILDVNNRNLLLKLLTEKLSKAFSHVVVTATLRGKIEDEKSVTLPGISKWILHDGAFTKIA